MESMATDFRTDNYEVRFWEEQRRWYVVNRQTGHHVGDFFISQGAAERWMVRCQDDYEAGRKIGQREHRHEGAAPGVTGAQLRERRAALGLSQAQLATALGTTENTIARWERSALTIAQPVLLDLALEALERRKGEA